MSASVLRSLASNAACISLKLARACFTNRSASNPGGSATLEVPNAGALPMAAGGKASAKMRSRGPSPAYCSGADGAEGRAKKRRASQKTPTISNIAIRMPPKSPDMPKCDSNAAKPSPAAMPASGPSQREAPDGAGAGGGVCGLGAGAAVGAPGCGCAWPAFAGAGCGEGRAGCGEILRWAPKLCPPPSRRASTSVAISAAAANATSIKLRIRLVMSKSSKNVTAMQGHDARGQIEPLHPLEPRLLHHSLERRLIRMHAYRLGKIAITGLVVGHKLAQARQHIETVPVVSWLKRLPHLTKLQDEGDTARAQDASHFGQRIFFARHVAQAEADADAIEAARREGKRLGVALNGRQQPPLVDHPVT